MRRFIKRGIYIIVYILIFPIGGLTRLLCRLLRWNMPFHFWAEFLAMMPGPPGLVLRSCFYNQVLNKAHYSLIVKYGGLFTNMDSEIGKNVKIGRYSTIGWVRMGDGASVSGHCSVLSGRRTHNFEDPARPVFDGEDFFTQTCIGENSFVGEHCTVMADIGDCTIIGAGSVVVENIPEYTVAVGNPARVVKKRPRTIDTDQDRQKRGNRLEA
jgi:acetyltransferase-like isoleucine patch superfamily enzyme